MTRAHATTNHERIREWIESRGGHPASVAVTGEQGLLRIDFEASEASLKEVDWDTFFNTFEHKQLAFLYQDETADGEPSRFNKFIDRSSTEASDLSDELEELDASANRSKASKLSKASTKASSTNKVGGSKTHSSAEDEDDDELDDDDFDDEDEFDEDDEDDKN